MKSEIKQIIFTPIISIWDIAKIVLGFALGVQVLHQIVKYFVRKG